MDIISYGIANKAGSAEDKTRNKTLAEGVQGNFPHTKARIDALEKAFEGLTLKANKLIVNDAVNIMKANARLNAIAKTTRYKMQNMIFDDLLDLSGVDLSKSEHTMHDSLSGLVQSDGNDYVVETTSEEAESVPEKAVLVIEAMKRRLASKFSTSGYARVTNIAAYRIPFATIEFWFKRASLGNGGAILSNTEAGGYSFYSDGTGINSNFRLGGVYRGVKILTNDLNWHHVAFTYDGKQVVGYLDGELAGTTNYNSSGIQYSTNTYLTFAAEPKGTGGTTDGWAGSLADIRIWNYARSAQEIAENVNRFLTGKEEGLVGNWRLDEESGNTLVDIAKGNNATASGMTRTEDYPNIDAEMFISDPTQLGKYEISRDGGATWEPIVPESLFYFDDNVSPMEKSLRIKASMNYDAKLLNYGLTWS